jgi:hypothetical protein
MSMASSGDNRNKTEEELETDIKSMPAAELTRNKKQKKVSANQKSASIPRVTYHGRRTVESK